MNPLAILDLTSDRAFKVIGDFQGQSYPKHAISALFLPVETHYVLPSYRKSWSRNPLMILVLAYDLSSKVICEFQGQTYANQALSPLLWPVEIQYVNVNVNVIGFMSSIRKFNGLHILHPRSGPVHSISFSTPQGAYSLVL